MEREVWLDQQVLFYQFCFIRLNHQQYTYNKCLHLLPVPSQQPPTILTTQFVFLYISWILPMSSIFSFPHTPFLRYLAPLSDIWFPSFLWDNNQDREFRGEAIFPVIAICTPCLQCCFYHYHKHIT